jgi:hypothetical protein
VGKDLHLFALRHRLNWGGRSNSFPLFPLSPQWVAVIGVYEADGIKNSVQSFLSLTSEGCGQSIIFRLGICSKQFITESAFIPFVSFGDLDNNTFKGLTSLLSVEQEIQYDEHT